MSKVACGFSTAASFPCSCSESTADNMFVGLLVKDFVSDVGELLDFVSSFGKSFPPPANNFVLSDCLKLSERPSEGLVASESAYPYNWSSSRC